MTTYKDKSLTYKYVNVYPTNAAKHMGSFSGVEPDYLYGRCLLTDAGDPERTIWSFADDNLIVRSDRKVFPTSTGNFYVASSNALDTNLQFTVSSIDENGDRVFLTATTNATNGQTPVNFGSGLDINFVFMSGDSQVNLGQIYFTNNPTFTAGQPSVVSSVLAHVPIQYGCSPQAVLRVPNGKIMVVNQIVITMSRTGGADGSAIIHARIKREGLSTVVAREWHWQTGQNVIPVTGMAFPAGTIVEFTIFDVSSVDTSIGIDCQFDYIEE